MAMGITQALKLQEGPIDALALLPQQQILALAQQKRIPADMVSIILNEKAQMEQQAANMQAMQQPMPPSVVEQAMAINAQAEAPPPQMPPMDAGVAALPVDDSMYNMAGGGIVAFAGPDGSFVQDDDMETRRLRETLRRKYAGIASPLGAFASVPASEIVGFQENRRTIQNLLGALPSLNKEQLQYMLANTPDITKVSSASPAVTSRNIDLSRDFKDTDTGVDLPQVKQPTAPTAASTKASGIAAIPKSAAPAKKEEAPEDFFARRNRMLSELGVRDTDAEDLMELEAKKAKLAGDREQAGYLALLEAGLGVMGGSSPYALQNIGAGAKGAVSSYGKSLREIKEDEKEFTKIGRELRKAADARKRGDVDKALEFEDKAAQRQIQLRGVQAQERSAGRPSSTAELMAALQSPDPKVRAAAESILGRGKTGVIDERFLMERWDKMDKLEKFKLQQQGIGYDQWAASKRAESGGAAGAPAAGGRVIDFGSIR